MTSIQSAPLPMQTWLGSLPSQNVGTLYAVIEHPAARWFFGLIPKPLVRAEYKVPVWGQVCDGKDHKSAVNLMLYNEFPNHGIGYTYISWRAEPDHPDRNRHPRAGLVENPQPFDGNTRT